MLCTGNIVRQKATGKLYECTCSEKNGIVCVRDIDTYISLRGGKGMFEDEHPATDFEKVASSKLDLKSLNL